jgi:hypothetical protein
MSVRLQGITGEVTIYPSTTNDKVWVSPFKLYKDNGAVVTASTAQELTLTRDAAKAQWHMIKTDAAGTAAIITGTLSSGTSFNDVWDTAGGPQYVGAADILIGAVKLTPGSAGPVAAANITYTLSTGTLIQERSDIPGYTILPVEGGILLNEALLGCHTAGATRTAYASFYDQYPLLSKVGDIEGWTLSGTSDTIEMEAAEDISAQVDLSGSIKWSGTFNRFYVQDDRVWKNAMERRTAILRLWPDANDTAIYYEGAVIIKDWGIDATVGNAIKENISFDGDGNLELRGM